LAHCYAQVRYESSTLAAAPHLVQASVLLSIYGKMKGAGVSVAARRHGAGRAGAYSTIRLTIGQVQA
jgi:hypothetical protein